GAPAGWLSGSLAFTLREFLTHRWHTRNFRLIARRPIAWRSRRGAASLALGPSSPRPVKVPGLRHPGVSFEPMSFEPMSFEPVSCEPVSSDAPTTAMGGECRSAALQLRGAWLTPSPDRFVADPDRTNHIFFAGVGGSWRSD